jgi:3-oxoacyl-[acyl-carrier protein] reductase
MKRALVTGGSGGIGAAICRQLAAQGLFVYVHGNRNIDKANAVVREIIDAGGTAEAVAFDVTDNQLCEQTLAELSQQGVIDVVVNNAGVVQDTPMAGMDKDAWDNVLSASLDGFFNVTRPLLMPMMRQRKGRIINITSVSGVMGNRGQANYAAAKSGLHGATKSLAQELASRKITVNAVAPGIIDAGMAAGKFDDKLLKAIVPMQRAGRAEEVAALVGFLASEQAGYITSQIICINGGMA